jgi:hypothetical protein
MPHYRIYTFGSDGHISGPSSVVECPDDQQAIRKPQQAADGKDVELWEQARFIKRFPADAATAKSDAGRGLTP